MDTFLSDIEVRILGALIEKQVTTPEYYPLTLNALTAACNQKNNRNPVTAFSDEQVAQGLESLREKNLAYVFYGSTSRVPKYKHVVPEVLHINNAETALMCVLMLRGPQTPGELRGNASRLYEFSGLEEIEETLNGLITHDPERLVVRLPRQPGQKEVRFAHLLSGEVTVEITAEDISSRRVAPPHNDRISVLEEQVNNLTNQFEELLRQFEEFKRQFE